MAAGAATVSKALFGIFLLIAVVLFVLLLLGIGGSIRRGLSERRQRVFKPQPYGLLNIGSLGFPRESR